MEIPWINKLVSFTATVLQAPHIKIIGVCFGHQIIGRVLGVEVGLNKMGWETAVLPINLTPSGKALFRKDKLVNLIVSTKS